jgi:hypothetical protein
MHKCEVDGKETREMQNREVHSSHQQIFQKGKK